MLDQVTLKTGSFKLNEIKAGELQFWRKRPYLGCPRCGEVLSLGNFPKYEGHEVIVQDEIITINPSIGHPVCGLHIFVKNGKIQWLGDFK